MFVLLILASVILFLVGVPFVIIAIFVPDYIVKLAFGGLGGLCLAFGAVILLSEHSKRLKTRDILERGTRYTAKIIGFEPGKGVAVNGCPPMCVVAEVIGHGGDSFQITVPTGGYSTEGYPLNAYCEIAVVGTEARIFKDTIRLGGEFR